MTALPSGTGPPVSPSEPSGSLIDRRVVALPNGARAKHPRGANDPWGRSGCQGQSGRWVLPLLHNKCES